MKRRSFITAIAATISGLWGAKALPGVVEIWMGGGDVRRFRVKADNIIDAINKPDVPQIGEPYSSQDRTLCVCSGVVTRVDDHHWYVDVRYKRQEQGDPWLGVEQIT